ncbi:hypothetical protein FGO68_gene12086 [Halteria grandinella]|uniref:Uncharacterized protein n=1 Tax=Halteria grandinella TaxID=5974 RepID=A0A8J8NNX5_HALGN|nr:hypothetical protein FGO68_gene12086 [Halteria grandinella]
MGELKVELEVARRRAEGAEVEMINLRKDKYQADMQRQSMKLQLEEADGNYRDILSKYEQSQYEYHRLKLQFNSNRL